MRPSPSPLRPSPTALLALVVALAPAAASAADLPPPVVASFARRVQPLVLNRCAAGACHGGPESPEPRFHRAVGGGQPARPHTLANLEALLDAIGPDPDARSLAAMLAEGHPQTRGAKARRAAPLTTPERISLDRWLAEVRAVEAAAPPADPGDVPASAELAAPPDPRPNRFRALLDAAANPPPLPPPEEPRGVIFKNDAPPEE
ncbi:MAG: hypothetical protein ACKON7_00560 [Planctomycetaceae bacterium]